MRHEPVDVSGIPGWFNWTDQRMFEHVLARQDEEPPGTLVELGAYLGKSAVLVGAYRRAGEALVVCDLFGEQAPDAANSDENTSSYRTLTRRQFEANYLRVHGDLPTVVHAPTSQILQHVAPGSARFVHVDASHLYEHVSGDLVAARTMLRPGGVVVCDDYRSPHTPGVAAAVWGAVHAGVLRPFCLTPMKMYACFDGDPGSHREAVSAWLPSLNGLAWEVQRIAGSEVLRIWPRKDAAAKPDPAQAESGKVDVVLRRLDALDRRLKQVDRVTRAVRAAQAAPTPPRRGPRRLVVALLPPGVRRALRTRLAGR